MQWHDLLDTKYWLLPFNNATFQGEPVHTEVTSLIIDTGTSLVLLPERDFAKIKQSLLTKNGLDFKPQMMGGQSAKCT
jgi:hypothetical protein